MRTSVRAVVFAVVAALGAAAHAAAPPKEKPEINPPPAAKDWADLSKLPDWSGTWNPKISDQDAQVKTNMPPWTDKAAALVKWQLAEERAGRPPPLFVNCLPESMPAWMLVTHNSMEILFTPGRVTLLGESDGNRLRRIYTDGRKHPADPDPTFHGHSIGHWEGNALIVDTVGVLPQALIAVSEAAGIPGGENMHIREKFYLADKDVMHVDLEITAPKVLTKPWKTTRIFFRQRARKYDIIEGVCLEGYFKPGKDKDGFDIFVPIQHDVGGNRVPPK